MAKINWSKALGDYLRDETLSYADIGLKYGVSKQSVTKRAVREEWQSLRTRTLLKVDQELPDKIGESIAEVKARHIRQAKQLQTGGSEALQRGMRPRNFREVVNGIVAGIKIERKILGLDDPNYKDPNWEKFQKFSFIFNMTREELQRYLNAIENERTKRKAAEIEKTSEISSVSD